MESHRKCFELGMKLSIINNKIIKREGNSATLQLKYCNLVKKIDTHCSNSWTKAATVATGYYLLGSLTPL